MYNFFVDKCNQNGERFFITGQDYNHIKNVLRMSKGSAFLVSCEGVSNLCEIESIENDTVVALIKEKDYQNTELPIKIHLFQGLPKSDKLELIIQKAVELGVYSITPVAMKRSVVKIDEKKKKNKIERWQSIATSAAKQSKRNFVPQVCDILTYREMIATLSEYDTVLVPYECAEGVSSAKDALKQIKKGMLVAIVIGPEGGFDPVEIELAENSGGKVISLGSRILRTETAAITATAMCMLYSEMELT